MKGLINTPRLTIRAPTGYNRKCSFGDQWEMIPLPMTSDFINGLRFDQVPTKGPIFVKFELYIMEDANDSFIDPVASGFQKGVIFINGRNLGRYEGLRTDFFLAFKKT